jgi:thioredoxin 1
VESAVGIVPSANGSFTRKGAIMMRFLMIVVLVLQVSVATAQTKKKEVLMPEKQHRVLAFNQVSPAIEFEGRQMGYYYGHHYVRSRDGWHSIIQRLDRWWIADESGEYVVWEQRKPLTASDDASIQKLLQEKKKEFILLDFGASWCGPCRQMEHLFCDIAETHSEICVIKVDADRCPQAVRQFGITAMPTAVLLQKAQEISRFTGAQNTQQVDEFIAKAVPQESPSAIAQNP